MEYFPLLWKIIHYYKTTQNYENKFHDLERKNTYTFSLRAGVSPTESMTKKKKNLSELCRMRTPVPPEKSCTLLDSQTASVFTVRDLHFKLGEA